MCKAFINIKSIIFSKLIQKLKSLRSEKSIITLKSNNPKGSRRGINKIILIILIVSPLLFVFFTGYPIQTYRETQKNGVILSKRCFKVGELKQFIRCFQSGKRISGIHLVTDLQTKLSSLFPFFDVVFFGGIAGIVIGILIL